MSLLPHENHIGLYKFKNKEIIWPQQMEEFKIETNLLSPPFCLNTSFSQSNILSQFLAVFDDGDDEQ